MPAGSGRPGRGIYGVAVVAVSADLTLGEGIWSAVWEADKYADGWHELTVTAKTSDGRTGIDTIQVLVSKAGEYDAPVRIVVDYENAFGAWPEKHILGTQLGPNENGHGWPPRRERIAR